MSRPSRAAAGRPRTRKRSAGTIRVDVSWGDQDPAAIVFYPRFFAWADAAGQRWFRDLGVPLEPLLRERAISFGLVACSATFRSPARGGDALRCRSRLVRLGDKTLEIAHAFRRGRTAVATVTEVRICMDLRDPSHIRARAVPADLRRKFERALA